MKSTVLITIAIGCGLIAALGVLQYMRHLPKSQAVQTKQIVVAADEIDINAPLTTENLRLAEWPSSQVPAGAISDIKELASKYARIRLYSGEVIVAAKVMGSDDASGSVRVPQGYRVVSVKSNAETAVSNLIEPGDRVDVIAILGARARTTAMAKTILRAARVFAINREMSRNPDGTVAADGARTVSLVVTPDQAEKLMMAAELGEIRLSLRSPDDPRVEETAGCTVRDVLGSGSVADEMTAGGLLASVSSRPLFETGVEDLVGRDAPAEPVWTMLLLSPEDTQTFTWSDTQGLPSEVNSTVGPPPATDDRPALAPEPDAEGLGDAAPVQWSDSDGMAQWWPGAAREG